MSPRVLGVIPARGASKRLPRKNVRMVRGKPLIAWTIEAAQQATRLTDYLVTSEDAEIIEIARTFGAPVPFVRPDELSGDKVRNIQTVIHALQFMEEATGEPYDMVVLLQPTAPVRDPAHIDQMVDALWASDLDSAASVKGPFKKRDPILKGIRDGVLEDYVAVDGDPEPFWMYNAALYATKREYLLREQKLVSDRQVPIPMDELHSADVDTEADLMKAEAFLAYLGR